MLNLKKSQLPNAGKGLFTDSAIKKGEIVVEYLGEIVTWAECEKRAEKDQGGYVFYINKNYCIDAFFTPEAMARYANDANGTSKVKGLSNNCVYEIRKKRAYIVSTKNIPAGAEIFVQYGQDYWDVINGEDENPKKKKNKKSSNGKTNKKQK